MREVGLVTVIVAMQIIKVSFQVRLESLLNHTRAPHPDDLARFVRLLPFVQEKRLAKIVRIGVSRIYIWFLSGLDLCFLRHEWFRCVVVEAVNESEPPLEEAKQVHQIGR